jgi:glutamine synthetase
MLEGMKANENRDAAELDRELHKKKGDPAQYLNPDREYVSELDIFDDYTAEERVALFGRSPRTVHEVMESLREQPALFQQTPLREDITNSFKLSVMKKWRVELSEKEIPTLRQELVAMRREEELENTLDAQNWSALDKLRAAIACSTTQDKSLFSKMEDATQNGDDELLSKLSLELDVAMIQARHAWRIYRRNLLI